MKNNKLAKLMAVVLLVTLLAVILVSGTYAKYTTSVSATDKATVAKWNITLNDKDISNGTTETLKLGLFDTINDSDYTSEETNVDAGKIAPGTSGLFTIANLKNNSEVDAEYKITYTIENTKNIPLEFSTDKTDWKKLEALSMNDFAELSKSGVSTDTIYWRWAFEDKTSEENTIARDTADTTIGVDSEIPTVTVTAKIDVQQKD